MTSFRAELSDWINHARNGEEIVITERGLPVARLTGIEHATLIDQLTAQGVVGKPRRRGRPKASGRARVRATGSVSDYIAEHRG